MAEQATNMVPISVIATDICQNFGDTTRKYFGEHLVNLINKFKDMHIFLRHNVSVKTIIAPVSNIVELPCGFIKETKVGIINANGRIACMSIDRTLRVPPQSTTDSEVEDAVDDIFYGDYAGDTLPFYNCHSFNGGFLGELYGYTKSINTLGYFNVIREDNTLIIAPSVRADNYIMEFITDGVSDGLQLVPSELVNCLKDGAKAEFCRDKKDSRYASYQESHEQHWKRAKKLYNAKPIDFYAEIFKQNHQSSPK